MIKHRFQLISITIILLLLFSQHELRNYAVTAAADTNNEIVESNTSAANENHDDISELNSSNNVAVNDTTSTNFDTSMNNTTNDKLPIADTESISTPEEIQSINDDIEKSVTWDAPRVEESNQEESDFFSIPFTTIYDMAVQAYLEDNWKDCITFFEIALHEFKVYRQAIINCRLQCWYKNEKEQPFFDKDIENLIFYDLILKRTLCLNECKIKVLRQQYLTPFYLEDYYKERFLSLKPYEYLQACYYRDTEYEMAASATYTALMYDIENTLMMTNMQFYLNKLKVDITKIKDLEEESFVKVFMDGIEAYNNEEYEVAVHHLEESLISYIMAEDECRVFCEGEFDHGGWQPDFISAIANHFLHVAFCKQNCTHNLSKVRGKTHSSIIATHYQYLQFAYFKINDIKKACRSLTSFLLFYPDDEEMNYNVEYYQTKHNAPNSYFTPTNEAVRYYERQKYERKLLSYAYEESYKVFLDEKIRTDQWNINEYRTLSELHELFSTNGTDGHGNGACIIKLPINLFKQNVIQIK